MKEKFKILLAEAGITINGDNPWDLQIHDERLWRRVMTQGALGLGEAYMDGWWDAQELDVFFDKLVSSRINEKIRPDFRTLLYSFRSVFLNLQSESRAFEIGERHYDIGNDLYEEMLDKRMAYTCGYWKDAHNLDEAQEAKLDLVCKKINLKKGDTVLDIGGGWGSFAQFAYERYGAETVAITVSKQQVELGRQRTKGMPIDIRLQDYRELDNEQFDHAVSLGMFEHVGCKNYRHFMKIVHTALKDRGLFLLHTIGGNASTTRADPWFDKYIFPNGMLPSIKQLGKSIEGLFVMEDWHNFGAHYDPTLQAWFKNFDAAWPALEGKYGNRFYRMWKYYLLSMAGAFRSRTSNQLWQVVLSKNGVRGGYEAVR